MKRMWSVLGAGLIAWAVVTPLLSCNVVKGELTLLVDNKETTAYSPCWSSDDSKIYFVSSEDLYSPGQVWSINLADETQKQLSEEEVKEIDISPAGDLCVTYLDGWILLLDTETWTQLDSLPVPEEFKEDWRNDFYAPRFSYESDQIIYYLYHLYSDSSYLHKVNLADSTDELILAAERGSVFAPGPGDTLFVLRDTIYNLNSQERIPIDIPDDLIEFVYWNPAVPTELIISTGPHEDIFIFDIQTQKANRIDTRSTEASWVGYAKFSPDGERIVFATLDAGGSWVVSRIWLFEPLD